MANLDCRSNHLLFMVSSRPIRVFAFELSAEGKLSTSGTIQSVLVLPVVSDLLDDCGVRDGGVQRLVSARIKEMHNDDEILHYFLSYSTLALLSLHPQAPKSRPSLYPASVPP